MIVVLIIVIGFQLFVLAKTILKIIKYKTVFPGEYELVYSQTIRIPLNSKNEIFATIARSINTYIINNGSRANDYHLMQDIVERNCESKEEEIHSQIPTTLYAGLVGTMIGIIIGIYDLFNNGGLKGLLEGTVSTTGIEDMLRGVALAMVASVCGIICTTVLTFLFKDAKSKNADGKNDFLSWLPANLLPTMSSDTFSALDKMSEALAQFNSQFASNTQGLNDTLALVKQTSENQALIMDTLNNLDVAEMAKANVKTYKALKDSSGEITYLAQMLHASQEYLNEVRSLNENLDKSEKRTQMIEEMGAFFKKEITAIEERKQMLMKCIDDTDKMVSTKLNVIAGEFESKTANALNAISDKFQVQNKQLSVLAGEQESWMRSVGMESKFNDLNSKFKDLDNHIEISQKSIMKQVTEITKRPNPTVTISAQNANPVESLPKNNKLHLVLGLLTTIGAILQIILSDSIGGRICSVALLVTGLALLYLYLPQKYISKSVKKEPKKITESSKTNLQHIVNLQTITGDYKYLRQYNNGCFNLVQDNYDGQSLYRMFNIKKDGTADFEFFGNEKELLANWSSILAPICVFEGDPSIAKHIENIKPGIIQFDPATNRWKIMKKALIKLIN